MLLGKALAQGNPSLNSDINAYAGGHFLKDKRDDNDKKATSEQYHNEKAQHQTMSFTWVNVTNFMNALHHI